MTERWQLWFVPTEKGKEAFKWKESPIREPFLATEDDARLERYLQDCDDTSPDVKEYRKIELRRA